MVRIYQYRALREERLQARFHIWEVILCGMVSALKHIPPKRDEIGLIILLDICWSNKQVTIHQDQIVIGTSYFGEPTWRDWVQVSIGALRHRITTYLGVPTWRDWITDRFPSPDRSSDDDASRRLLGG